MRLSLLGRPPSVILSASEGSALCPARDPSLRSEPALERSEGMTVVLQFTSLGPPLVCLLFNVSLSLSGQEFRRKQSLLSKGVDHQIQRVEFPLLRIKTRDRQDIIGFHDFLGQVPQCR